MMSIVLTLGLVMMAACTNVQTYAAAQVFYWMGYLNTLSLFILLTELICLIDIMVLPTP